MMDRRSNFMAGPIRMPNEQTETPWRVVEFGRKHWRHLMSDLKYTTCWKVPPRSAYWLDVDDDARVRDEVTWRNR